MIPAVEAEKIGIVNKVCSQKSLMEETIKVAGIIASKGKVSIRAAKQAIDIGANVDLHSGCNIEIDAFALCMASEDAKEGTTAFIEKRAAKFKGRLG